MCIDDDDCEFLNKECKKLCKWYLICISIPYLLLGIIWAIHSFCVSRALTLTAVGFGLFSLGFFVVVFISYQAPWYIYYWIKSWWCRRCIEDCERLCVWLCCGDNNVSTQPVTNNNPQIPIDTGNPKITLDIEGQIYRIELNGNQNNIKLDTCSICLEKTVEKPQDCGHVFHKECLDKWLMKEKSCPNCRKDIRKS